MIESLTSSSSCADAASLNRSDRQVFFWIGLAFALMQCGPVLSALEYSPQLGKASDLWMMFPFMFLALLSVWLTWRMAVPRLLSNGRTESFVAIVFGMSYVVSLVELLLVEYIWVQWGILPRGKPISVGWLMLNAVSNSLMFFFTLLALGLWRLYRCWSVQLELERRMSDAIIGYIDDVKNLLRPEFICDYLRQTVGIIGRDSVAASERLSELSAILRTSLKRLPTPPELDEQESTIDTTSGLNLFLIGRRYKFLRIVLFQVILCLICFGAFFAGPDSPEFSERAGGTLTLLLLFESVAAADYFILFRRFRKKRRPHRFIIGSVILALLVVLPLLGGRIALYLEHPYDSGLFLLTTILATSSSLVLMAFFVLGLTAMLLYCDWLRENNRTVLLQAANARLEYAHLRRQINPHFLFNVLNNASILASDDPAPAKEILNRLIRLMEFQFSESYRSTTLLSDAVDFLSSYLALEASRYDNLVYHVDFSGDITGVAVPSLLYIPFVENAVKFATPEKGVRSVKVDFIVSKDSILFTCINTYDPMAWPDSQGLYCGGLGLSNTLRRLQLLYEDRYHYEVSSSDGLYRVRLRVPVV